MQEQNRQSRNLLAIGNAFTSLRQLLQLNWNELFENLSRVNRILGEDPSGIYPEMDFPTRDSYRRVVEELSQLTGFDEEEVARAAVKTAREGKGSSGNHSLNTQVGYYLVGKGRKSFIEILGCKDRIRCRLNSWIRAHHCPVYLSGVSLVTLLVTGAFVWTALESTPPLLGTIILLLALLPSSQLAINLVNLLVIHILQPQALPKMDFRESGVRDEFKTLVVIPTILVNKGSIKKDLEKIEMRYLANQDKNILFSLFTDFTDSSRKKDESDSDLIDLMTQGIRGLNKRYGKSFLLFHRERSWSESEQLFIGWERKRGKLEQLNELLDNAASGSADKMLRAGSRKMLSGIRFVITLDSDTQLPHGTARRLIETLAHPLNQPRFDDNGNIIPGTYTIIQPRITTSLPSRNFSVFSRYFSDSFGMDPYCKVVSDVYQDLAGEGSYHGKGIYDVQAFSRLLAGRFPENLILSHDLLEGVHAGVGLASDIELYDEFPRDYLSYARRLRRWIRGDWQIAAWLFPWVPGPDGKWGKNPLSLFSRWKVMDNLRRSLVPVSIMSLLVFSWMADRNVSGVTLLLVGLHFLWPALCRLTDLFSSRNGLKNFSPLSFRRDVVHAVAEAAMLPHIAFITLSAIFRVIYRLFISHRHLLEWGSAQVARHEAKIQRKILFLYLLSVSLLAVMLCWMVDSSVPENLIIAAPFTLLWFLSPFIGWLLTSLKSPEKKPEKISARDRDYLRHIARRTWRFFDDFVTPGTNWLPPDNYQVSHQDQIAMRTSPTNIGFWMLSVLGAKDLGYISAEEVLDRLSNTMASLSRLEKHEGHLLNWYDISDLKPLEPRYVSSVDSGNLIASIWVLATGLRDMLKNPVFDKSVFQGFVDSGGILQDLIQQEGLSGKPVLDLEQRMGIWRDPPASPLLQIRQVLEDSAVMPGILSAISKGSSDISDIGYWCDSLQGQITGAEKTVRTFYGWYIPLLNSTGDTEPRPENHTLDCLIKNTRQLPALESYTAKNPLPRPCPPRETDAADIPAEMLREMNQAYQSSRKAGAVLSSRITHLADSLEEFGRSINMNFLYSPERKLFAVGFNVSSGRLDNSFYDLLASEARLSSFISIARGEIPMEHWFSLGRPHTQVGRYRVLMSWSGTMFEYLMPLLLQHPFENTLLNRAATRAVDIQIRYGNKRNLPWGMSESAYGNLDLNKNYQYKAFGIPELSLKRMMQDQIVVAPYATMLALGLRPKKSLKNLKRLEYLGLYNEYGFYESVDFSRKAKKGGEKGIIIQTYMAHHQGMVLLSLVNFLRDNIFRQRFHSHLSVKAYESMLHEKIPSLPQLQLASSREETERVTDTGGQEDITKRFTTPHTATPKTRLLSNGSYNMMLTNSGGGYSQWRGLELTRWRSDRTTDYWGSYLYIYEKEADRLWSAAHLPVNREAKEYEVSFSLDKVSYARSDFDIQSEMDVVVSPEDDVEIRRLSLTNRSDQKRTLLLTSYSELSMTHHNSDLQHPAFNKLFIQTEAIPESKALLAYRRSRTAEPPDCFLAHCLAGVPLESPFNFETSRNSFIGRGNTLSRPAGAVSGMNNNQGFVLDPVFSLGQEINLNPEQRREYAFILAAAPTRDKVLSLVEKYSSFYHIERALEFAWRKAQVELRLLHIQPEEARWFQQLANHLIYPNQLLRAPNELIAENHKGQAGLWPYGVSGDLPIILVTIAESKDINLIRQLLKAQTYWRMHGFMADLLILNEEESGYQQVLREKLVSLIQVYSQPVKGEMQGSVLLRNADQIPEDDLRLLKAAAGVVLVAARGELAQQLGVSRESVDSSEALETKSVPLDPPQKLQEIPLLYYNGFGGFTLDGREYVITLKGKKHTPLPWINVMANPEFGSIVSESGGGFTWFGNSQRNRLSQWTNDPVLDSPSEIVYLRDEETGDFWTIPPWPDQEEGECRIRHGAGYTLFEKHSFGIKQELKQFVPVDSDGGAPVKFFEVNLQNDTDRWRRLSITFYIELVLGENRENTQMHTVSHWDRSSSSLICYNRYHPEYGERVTFVTIDPKPDSYTGNRSGFIGRNQSVYSPAALKYSSLDNTAGTRLDPCAGLQTKIRLAAGESVTAVCMLGQSENKDEACSLVEKYRKDGAVQEAFNKTLDWWDHLLGGITIKTPDTAADLLVNRWLLYQSLSCRIWGRSAFYQSGGAFGFRDQLQDVTAFLTCRPELARKHILLAASRQFLEGDVQHWWHPPSGAGIRSRISDDLLWLPYVVAQYVKVTGDSNILHEEIPFLNSPVLEDGQQEVFSLPEQVLEQASLFEHCRRAVAKGLTAGPGGLPLFGSGDWNDGMNMVGSEGKGESVWLGWFLIDVLQGMIELSKAFGEEKSARHYARQKAKLRRRIEEKAWDGKWYLRGRFDDGTPLGSAQSLENQIDSLPQSWAWLSGAADPERADMALEAAWNRLVLPKEKIIALFEPPFDKSPVIPGYIKGYPPGVRENGGQYTHGAIWLAMAMARKGDGERAVKMLKIMSPVEHSSDPEKAIFYGLEPYAVAADVYRLKGNEGKGGWSWYTGSAAWMYRAWTEEILGIRRRGDFLLIDPVLPSSWRRFDITFRFAAAVYKISVDNPEGVAKGVESVKLNGKGQDINGFPLARNGEHIVEVLMGSSSCKPEAPEAGGTNLHTE